jgi:peptidoglycan/xylan/chitin deacetylase (PgdA/CDA1 family)
MREISKTSKRKQYSELCLNWDEIKYLDSNELITIGAHSHTHPKLKNLTYEESFYEINKSKEILEEKLSSKVDHFAYPYGGLNDIGQKELEIIKICGFDTATTTIKKSINNFNRYLVPRVLIQDYMSQNGFKAVLSGWSNLLARLING